MMTENSNEKVNAIFNDAVNQPWQYSFYSLVRLVNAQYANLPLLGKAKKPKHENLRFGQYPALTFAPREIAHIKRENEHYKISVFGLGMLGPNGALPLHYTEIVKDGVENRKDNTLANFLDMFHHRYISLMYYAWAQSKPVVSLDRKKEDYFSSNLAKLIGIDAREQEKSVLPLHARFSMIPHLIHEAKTPENLEASLNQFFSVPIKLEEFQMHWLKLEENDTTRLGFIRQSSYLEEGAVLGGEVPDCQSKFRLTIGPMSLQKYMRFTPNGEDFLVLVEIVRSFIGFELVWDIKLTADNREAHAVQLGENDRLGWSTWLGDDPDKEIAVGMTFEPELYMSNRTTFRE